MSYAQYRATARIIGKPPDNNVDGSADGNRIPPHHAASHQTPLKSVILHRIPPYHAQRIGLRIRRSPAPATDETSSSDQFKRTERPGSNRIHAACPSRAW